MSGDRGRRPRGPRSGLSVARAEGRARPRGGRATQGERQEDLGKLFRIEFQATSTHSKLDRLSDMLFACGEWCEVSTTRKVVSHNLTSSFEFFYRRDF